MSAQLIKVGDHVGYADISLSELIGEVVSIGRTPRGGDCVVRWYAPSWYAGNSEECLSNLRIIDRRTGALPHLGAAHPHAGR